MIFVYQLVGWAVIAAWSFCWSFLIYGLLKYVKLLRTDLKTEIVGYDFIEFAQEYELKDDTLTPAAKQKAKTP